ncbi:MAG: hypothetical protein HY369_02085 [Candidatus Aenigmarchaeota archaeon]|nr:hypothetical protein [Candidatus Aenigmarchaeota archaeon]
MPQNLLGIHGVVGLICVVGEGGKILHFAGDLYEPREVLSPTENTLRAVWIDSPQSAWAVGDGGTVLHWDGRLWHPVALASKHDALLSVWGCGGDIWIGGAHRLILHRPYSVGGMLVSTQHTVKGIWGTGKNDVWLLANDATVIHIGGDKYQQVPISTLASDRYNAIGGNTSEDVFIVGDKGLMGRWDGAGWTDLPTCTGENLNAVCGGDAGDAWAVTSRGELLHYGGIGWETAAVVLAGLNGVYMVDGVVWCCGKRGIVVQHLPEQGDGG